MLYFSRTRRALFTAVAAPTRPTHPCFRRLSSQPTTSTTAEQLSRATQEFNEELTAVFGGKGAEQGSLEDAYQMNRSLVAQQHEYRSEHPPPLPLEPLEQPPPSQPAQAVVHVRHDAAAPAPSPRLPAIHIHVPSGQGAATLHVDITIRLK